MKTNFSLLALLVAVLSVPLTHGQEAPTNGLIAYYPFDGDAKDASGNGHNGTVTSAVLTTDRFGYPGAAFAFDGASSVITVPHSDVLNLVNTDFTITLWAVLNAPHTVSPQFYLVSKNDNGQTKWMFGYGGTLEYQETRTIYFMKSAAGDNVWYADGRAYTATANTWHHYMIRKAGATYTSYIDGQPFNSETNPSEPFSGNTAPLTIGRAENLSVKGKLDDIRIYNRALSDSEVQQVYASEVAPTVTLIKAVKPSFAGLSLGMNYQLQVSGGDFSVWTNHGAPFTATGASMIYPQYWDVDNWDDLYFRLQVAP